MSSSDPPQYKEFNGSFGSHFNLPSSFMSQDDQSIKSNVPKSITPNSSSRRVKTKKKSKLKKRKKKSCHAENGSITSNVILNSQSIETNESTTHDSFSNSQSHITNQHPTQYRYSLPTQDFIPNSPMDDQEVKKIKKVKKMKKSKKHRKRHVLPGPAGALQLSSDPSLLKRSVSENKDEQFSQSRSDLYT